MNMNRGLLSDQFYRLLWAALIVLLPVTSFPFIVHIVGSDVVGLPSGILMGVMALAWFLPAMLKQGELPRSSLPLLGFVLAAVLSSALAVFRATPAYKGHEPMRESITGLMTLGLGGLTFLVTSQWAKQSDHLKTTLKLINYSGAFVLAWSIGQMVAWQLLGGYPRFMEVFHRFFSTGVLYKARVTGLALEPSWFAHQLNLLYLPLWFSATVTNTSAHHRRVLGISLENVLFIVGVGVLFLTLSRVGYLSFLLMVGVVFLQINGWVLKRVQDWIVSKFGKGKNIDQPEKRTIPWLRIVLTIVLVIVYLGILAGAAMILGKVDARMATLFQFDVNQDQWLYRYLGKLDLGPRVSFWLAGWNVFRQAPLLGVGLGNSGFYFMDALPDFSWGFPEIRSLMLQGSSVLNPKNLWSRLLAETGILGFSLFTGWLVMVAQTARNLKNHSVPAARQMGWMGLFVLAAMLTEGFSVDSFALIYYWFSFGLVSAAGLMAANRSDTGIVMGESH